MQVLPVTVHLSEVCSANQSLLASELETLKHKKSQFKLTILLSCFIPWEKKKLFAGAAKIWKPSEVEVNTIFRTITMSVVSAEETTAMPLYCMHILPIFFVLGLVKVKR